MTHRNDRYVGNPTCLNVRDANASFARIGPDQGLPVGNITSLAVASDVDGSPQLWVGSAYGIAVWQPTHDPSWRYMYGPRWLAGFAVKQIVSVPHAGSNGDTVVVLTESVSICWAREVSIFFTTEMWMALGFRHLCVCSRVYVYAQSHSTCTLYFFFLFLLLRGGEQSMVQYGAVCAVMVQYGAV